MSTKLAQMACRRGWNDGYGDCPMNLKIPELDFSSTAQAPYRNIRDDIINGMLLPDEKLKIRDLRLRYNIGSSPLREALSKLTADGFVTRTENRGFRVAHADVNGYSDLLNARCWIESVALRDAVASGDSNWEYGVLIAGYDLDKAYQLLDQDEGINPDFERLHKRYHMALIAGCNNKVVQDICSQLYDHATRYRLLSHVRLDKSEHDSRAAEHREITKAALAREADRSVELLSAHYRRTATLLGRDDASLDSAKRPATAAAL
jgi:GntR family transcriptional regulator, carbon starvation induced regulator